MLRMASYKHIYNDLRRRIAEGEFPSGSTLPGTDELKRQYDAALHTVRRAQHALRDEGLIQTQQGHPTKVLRAPVPAERPVAEVLAELGAAVRTINALWQELQTRLA